jgi:hypothetical protein
MNMDEIESTATPGVAPAEGVAPSAVARRATGRLNRVGLLAGTVLVGGGALVALLGPLAVSAASPSPDPSTPAASSGSSGGATPVNPDASGGTDAPGKAGGAGCMGGPNEAVDDLSVAATAIGISEADLRTAVESGQTIADVAKAKNVDPQKVIDALVQDSLDELAAAVKAGTITQAQADARKADVTQHATDQVNGTFRGGHHGPGGRGGHGPTGRQPGSGTPQPSDGTAQPSDGSGNSPSGS